MRSKWKIPHIDKSILKNKPQKNIYSRSSTILPEFINQTFNVHNGRQFIPVLITKDKIGHKFGEFAFTKKPAIYKK